MTEKPLLSIVCVTYNHEAYIAKAIEGFLMQKTTFPTEILIGEDCSTDRTREICLEYQKKYPEKIKLFLREKNLGAMANHLSVISECRGKYIANCEGDDYWTDPYKLQKQVDFLESQPDFAICGHNVKVVYEDRNRVSDEWQKKKEIMTIQDIFKHGGAATCSLVFRNKVFGDFPAWFREQKGGDWSLQLLCASKGKMKYFPEAMGVYRIHGSGSHHAMISEAGKNNQDHIAYLYQIMDQLLDALDKHFGYKYKKLLDISRNYNILNTFSRYSLAGDFKNSKKYASKLLLIILTFPPLLIFKIILKMLFINFLPERLALKLLKINVSKNAS